MTELQFSLFFVAIVVGYVLVHMRLVRFEAWLRKMGELETLNERLDGVARTLERVRLDRVEEALATVHDDLGAVRDDLAAVERAIREAADRVAAPPPAVEVRSAAPDTHAPDRIRAVVEARLLELGYRELRLLSDLADARSEDRTEVRVEATRRHMPMKGTVVVRNGSVVDVALQSAAKSFP